MSLQTLAGYQTALSAIINPRLGGLRLTEARTGVVDEALARVDHSGRTTRVARSVLAQMFAMAVRHDALTSNPMREVRPCTSATARSEGPLGRASSRPASADGISSERCCSRRAPACCMGGAPRSPDLHDVVLLLLGTGMRIGEALALEWTDLDLDADIPCVRVAATMVEPRRDAASGQVFVAGLHRQPMTKTGTARTIALPCAAVEMLNRRRAWMEQHDRQPVFAHAGGGWLWPNNVRTKLRGVVAGTPLVGVSPHTLRRTVGTLVAHSAGLDAARDILGHRDPSVTARHYIADTGRVIDVRHTLDPLFA